MMGSTASFHPDGRELQRSGYMADEQDPPDSKPDPTDGPPAPQPPAKKAPAKTTPAKKAPAKKTPAKAAKKAVPAKATPAKKTPAKKTPPAKKVAEPAPMLADTNGSSAAKETAAQAKSTVTTAVPPTLVPQPRPERSNMPIAAAIAAGVLAILVVLLTRRGSDDD
jgi:hypothetical protein